MPQTSPMNWMLLSYTMIYFMFLNSNMIFFLPIYSTEKQNFNTIKSKIINWKW